MQDFPEKKKKKKVDQIALMSPFMRIPRMDIRAARLLLDLNYREIYELVGRSPETLIEEAYKRKLISTKELLPHLRMAVYFAESDSPEPSRLHPQAWTD